MHSSFICNHLLYFILAPKVVSDQAEYSSASQVSYIPLNV